MLFQAPQAAPWYSTPLTTLFSGSTFASPPGPSLIEEVGSIHPWMQARPVRHEAGEETPQPSYSQQHGGPAAQRPSGALLTESLSPSSFHLISSPFFPVYILGVHLPEIHISEEVYGVLIWDTGYL